MQIPKFIKSYRRQMSWLLERHSEEEAMSRAVGCNFDGIGQLEYRLLRQYGLEPHHSVVDVGCGSGRLAAQLKGYLQSDYLGIDIVPDLLKYAEALCKRPDWQFRKVDGLTIPAADGSADFVVFFSVVTHLTQEHSYRYLAEARRVLKPHGKIIFSFLEFAVPAHWAVFDVTLNDPNPDKVLNEFIGRDAIAAWAEHLGLRVQAIHGGDEDFIALEQPVQMDDGSVLQGSASLGQSVCVLTKAQ